MFKVTKKLTNGDKLYLVLYSCSVDYEPTGNGNFLSTSLRYDIRFMSEREAHRQSLEVLTYFDKATALEIARDTKGDVEEDDKSRVS